MAIKHKAIAAAALALMLSSAVCAQDGRGRVSPTADIDAPILPVMDAGIERDATQDASLQGGAGTIGQDSRIPIPAYTCANYPGSPACNTTPPVVSAELQIVNPRAGFWMAGAAPWAGEWAGPGMGFVYTYLFEPFRSWDTSPNNGGAFDGTLRYKGVDRPLHYKTHAFLGNPDGETGGWAYSRKHYVRFGPGGARSHVTTHGTVLQSASKNRVVRVTWVITSPLCDGPHPAGIPGNEPGCTNIIFE